MPDTSDHDDLAAQAGRTIHEQTAAELRASFARVLEGAEEELVNIREKINRGHLAIASGRVIALHQSLAASRRLLQP